jgi:hypothetical protein
MTIVIPNLGTAGSAAFVKHFQAVPANPSLPLVISHWVHWEKTIKLLSPNDGDSDAVVAMCFNEGEVLGMVRFDKKKLQKLYRRAPLPETLTNTFADRPGYVPSDELFEQRNQLLSVDFGVDEGDRPACPAKSFVELVVSYACSNLGTATISYEISEFRGYPRDAFMAELQHVSPLAAEGWTEFMATDSERFKAWVNRGLR